ncbi:MAG: YraN family protein [Clostridia bacterium]|jgi:putative endonuclease|nr:YraN family protein [Clostridia bacterium]
MAQHNETGEQGEELAAQYLANAGYKILERNWHFGKNEIDLIAQDGEFIVFAEVKTRRTANFGEPEVFVTRAKQRAIIKAANGYFMIKDVQLEARFDIISVLYHGASYTVKQIKNAFYPTL